MGATTYYQPGVCNINTAEIKHRRASGRRALIVTLTTVAALVSIRANYLFGLIVFIPAWAAAIGFLQARAKFCVNFAARAQYSTSDAFGDTKKVTDTSDHHLDQSRARTMNVQAIMIGLGVTFVTCGILFLL